MSIDKESVSPTEAMKKSYLTTCCFLLLILFHTLLQAETFEYDPDTGEEINEVCAGCHGEYGEGGKEGEYPRIASMATAFISNAAAPLQGRGSAPIWRWLSISMTGRCRMRIYFISLNIYPGSLSKPSSHRPTKTIPVSMPTPRLLGVKNS